MTPLDSSLHEPHEPQNTQTVVNVYKSYVPLALVATGAIVFLIFGKFGGFKIENKQTEKHNTAPAPVVRREPEIDPFEIR